MTSINCVPSFGRYEFIIRRLHSLTGLIPVGGYLAFHLLTNASILDGVAVFQDRVNQIANLGNTTLFLLEWPFIFLPILFHSIIGVIIVCRGKRNVADYPYVGNIRYTLQRLTGVIAFLFILYHVFQMHGWIRAEWWREIIAAWGGARFNPADAVSAAAVIQSSIWVEAVYVIGVLACVYHFANGIWTMGITWGVWTSPRAQRWANVLAAAVGIFFAIIGVGALVGMSVVDTSAPRPPESPHAIPAQQLVHDPGILSSGSPRHPQP